jgi:hypothetical protein
MEKQEQIKILKHLVNELFNLVDALGGLGDDRREVLSDVYDELVMKSNNFKY